MSSKRSSRRLEPRSRWHADRAGGRRSDGREGRCENGGGAGTVPGSAVLAGDQGRGLRVRVGPARARARPHGADGRDDPGADGAGLQEPGRDPRRGRQRARPAGQDDGLPPEPRRLPRDERGVRTARGRPAAGPLHGRGRPASVRRPRRDRSRRQAVVRLEGLEQLGPVLEALPGPAYLVGGAVRDLLLYRPGFDVDLVVVGDAEAYANALAERLGGRVVTHGRFGTAVVHYGTGQHLDVATARTETYPEPGALPEVAPAATIEDDLGRRDFTINAMAVGLPDRELVDPFSGRSHLTDRLVRVLHEGSFVDDPTRIFRAAQYEGRLGFRMDPKTETLALMAVPEVSRLSGARVREELLAILSEERAPEILGRLH